MGSGRGGRPRYSTHLAARARLALDYATCSAAVYCALHSRHAAAPALLPCETAHAAAPVLQVESIVLSIISMLSSPNDESPANIDAAKQVCGGGAGWKHAWKGGRGHLGMWKRAKPGAAASASCPPARLIRGLAPLAWLHAVAGRPGRLQEEGGAHRAEEPGDAVMRAQEGRGGRAGGRRPAPRPLPLWPTARGEGRPPRRPLENCYSFLPCILPTPNFSSSPAFHLQAPALAASLPLSGVLPRNLLHCCCVRCSRLVGCRLTPRARTAPRQARPLHAGSVPRGALAFPVGSSLSKLPTYRY